MLGFPGIGMLILEQCRIYVSHHAQVDSVACVIPFQGNPTIAGACSIRFEGVILS